MMINVEKVMKILDVPQSTAYKLMRELNKELEDKGYLTVRGKVEEKYLLERYRLDEK